MLAAVPIISEFMASNSSGLVDDNGRTSDWIEIYNAGDAAINLAGYTLTDNPGNVDKYILPSVNLPVGGFLTVFAADDVDTTTGTDLYTGFGLQPSGEYIGLYDATGAVVSEFAAGGSDYPQQYTDISYGVRFDVGNFDQLSYFGTPTPGGANIDPADGVAERVTADTAAGFYETTIQVALTTPTAGSTIRYTVDGSTPSATNGAVYSGPVSVSSTTNIRAIATRAGFLTVPDRTWSYIFVDDVLTQSNNGSAPSGWPTSWGGNVVDYGIDPQVVAIEGAQAVRDALLAIPTWSITTDLDNLFDDAIGIYSNANQDGIEWERPASVELLHPDGSDGFQVNAGLRIRGGYSRSNNNPKHAFKLFFRGEYGDSNLEFPIHDGGTEKFEKIDLRTAQNYSWSFGGDQSNNFIADVLARNSQLALGESSTRSSWLHLYLNGQYWGLFQTQERADANFAESYFGGDANDYDVLKPERGPYTNQATDGNFAAFSRLFDQALARDNDGVTPNFVNHDAYLRAQGLNSDGTRNDAFEVLLDVDNLIAYMTVILSTGNFDAPISNFLGNNRINNFFAVRDRTGDEGFRYFVHDSEHSLRNVNENRNGPYNHSNFESGVAYFNPQWLHQQLMANQEYRIQFADSIYKNYFNGGPLTADAQIDRLDMEAAAIDQAIIAESARWGDSKTSSPRLRADWLNAVADLRDNYLVSRNSIFLEQLRNTVLRLKDGNGNYNTVVAAPLFPSVDAPTFLIDGSQQSGGLINVGSELRLVAGEPTVYYTLDDSDPRLVGGGVNQNALVYDQSTVNTTVVTEGSTWKYHDLGTDLGTAWRAASFDDSTWNSGNAELGYGDGDEATVVSFGGDGNNKHPTTYFRKTFDVAAGQNVSALLRLRRDDGAAVYLNGVEIARDNLPTGVVSFSTFASALASDDGNTWLEFVADASLLTVGDNTLAVEIHQRSATSSDISFDAEFIVSTSSTAPLILNNATIINSRSRASDGTWSPRHRASYILEAASQASIRISEVNYNPHEVSEAEIAAGFSDNDKFEFIELVNSHPTGTVELSGMQLTNGVTFAFGDLELAPGDRVVVVENTDAFALRYGTQVVPIGQWSGGLSNNGETISLSDSTDLEVMSLTYNDTDPWSIAADGAGASLMLDSPFTTGANKISKYYSWRASTEYGGTPGTDSVAASGVVINEVLAHTDAPLVDSIELFNPTIADINISGWYLSDSGNNPAKYLIPAGTIIDAGGYLVFDESDFNPTPATPGPNDFALNATAGDQVWLTQVVAGVVSSFEDVVEFNGTFNGQSVGRLPDGTGRLTRLNERSFGEPNGRHAFSSLVISEVNYHPSDPATGASITTQQLEFVEITNPTSAAIDLTEWRIRGEIDFDFDSGAMISAGVSILVIPFDPHDSLNTTLVSEFRTHYGIDASVELVGGFGANLSNSFGRISLQQPDAPDLGVIPRVVVDEVVYDDLAPFADADGNGSSLHRISATSFGDTAISWFGNSPTPGMNSFGVASVAGRSVFYNNSVFDGADGNANSADDDAIAIDKQALLPGQTATFANYTSYRQGINGVFVDVYNLNGSPSASDFQLAVGNGNDASDFSSLGNLPSVSVRPGDGFNGSDRISLTLSDALVTGTWLRITVSAGLPVNDVFYFGNQIGETGNSAIDATVSNADVNLVRSNRTIPSNPAAITNVFDFDRDEKVSNSDVNLARQFRTNPINRLKLIQAPANDSEFAFGVTSGDGDDGKTIPIDIGKSVENPQSTQGGVKPIVETEVANSAVKVEQRVISVYPVADAKTVSSDNASRRDERRFLEKLTSQSAKPEVTEFEGASLTTSQFRIWVWNPEFATVDDDSDHMKGLLLAKDKAFESIKE